jgi:hypothetical protein
MQGRRLCLRKPAEADNITGCLVVWLVQCGNGLSREPSAAWVPRESLETDYEKGSSQGTALSHHFVMVHRERLTSGG